MFFAVHEMTHKIQRDNPAAYKVLSDFIADRLNGDTVYNGLSFSGNTLDERIQSVVDLYASQGKTLTHDEAFDEIIADAVPVLLTDAATVKDLVRLDRTLAERIHDFFEGFYNSLVEATANLVYGDANKLEFQALANDRDAAKSIADMFKAALEARTEAGIDDRDGMYAMKTFDRVPSHLEENIRTVCTMENVIDMTGNEFPKGGEHFIKRVERFFAEHGNSAYNDEIGDVDMVPSSINDDIAHGYGPLKIATFAAVPSIIEKGKVVHYADNWQGRGYDTLVIAAPISIGNKPYLAGVRVMRRQDTDTQRYYVHEVLAIEDKKELSSAFTSRISAYGESSRAVDNSSINSILKRIMEYKYQNADFQNTEAEEFSDSGRVFSIRSDDPPKKTVKGYKVFVVFENKPGQLFPPMVANPNGESTPTGVWLDADIGIPAPDSKSGRKQVKAGGKGTQSSGGSLAFRPGWHLGDIPIAKQFARTNPETGKKELFPANFVWAECDCAADVDYQDEAMEYGKTENGKFQHSLAGLQRLPREADGTAGFYRYRTNPNPDTVPWIITGAMKVNRILDDADTDAILRENGIEPMQRQGGPIDLAKFGLERGVTKSFSMKTNGRKYTYEETPDYDSMHVDARTAIKNAEELERVKEENRRLSGMVDALREQFQVTKGYKPNEKALNRVARSILRKYGSQYDQQQLADDLRGLFDTIGNEQEFDGDAAMAAATTIARKVLNESTERDDSVYDATADAREYFRRGHFALTETQKQEVARAYEGVNGFRRQYFGKIGISKDGITLDECWEEICGITGLDPDTNEGDQPRAFKSPQVIVNSTHAGTVDLACIDKMDAA